MVKVNNNFSMLLGARRKRISDVYEATKISRTTLTNFYYENSDIKASTMLKLCDYLNVTPNELLIKKTHIENDTHNK